MLRLRDADANRLSRRLDCVRSRAVRSLVAVDTHTSGEPTRVLVDPFDGARWASAASARDALRLEWDWIRRMLTYEPRGHRGMFAAAVVPLEGDDGSWGVVFLCPDGYPGMCGHATMGVATVLVELGLITAREGETTSFTLDTPGGPIDVAVEMRAGRPARVCFRNRPAFLLERVTLDTPVGVPTEVPVAWGGQWYAFVPAAPFGLAVAIDQADRLVAAADGVRDQVNARIDRTDPRDGSPVEVGNVMWVNQPADGAHARNVPISPTGTFDRSPCGTGTSAKTAVLHADGQLQLGELFVNEGILGTRFEATIVETVDLAGLQAVVPEVSGEAWLSGLAEFWVDAGDPLADGFLPGDTNA